MVVVWTIEKWKYFEGTGADHCGGEYIEKDYWI